MDCLVEDYVYDDLNTTSNQLVYCGINNLFGEITWFYPTATSNNVNRAVTYSYLDSTANDLYGLQMQVVYFLEQLGKTLQYLAYHMELNTMQTLIHHSMSKVIQMARQFILNMKQELTNKKQQQELLQFQQILHLVIMILHKKL